MVWIISSGSLFWVTSPVSTSWSFQNSKIEKRNAAKYLLSFELNPLECSSVGDLMGFMMDDGNTVEPTS